MIRPWIFEFANCAPAPGETLYDWYLDLWQQAETIGFDGIFFSEHHFRGQAASPSPHLLLAAAAVKTSRLRLGVMGSVLPLHTPWRVAEEIGMLDHLTKGRLEIGYSSGIGPMETTMAGIPPNEVRPRFDEAIEVIENALLGQNFEHCGSFWNFGPITSLPRPFGPLPPRWMTVMSPGGAQSAASRGFKICTGFLPVAEVVKLFDLYRETHGGPCPDRLGLRRQIFIAPTDSEARDLTQAAAQATKDQMAGRAGGHAQTLVPDAPQATATKSPFDFMFGADEQICGSPASVAEQIIAQCRATGAGHILGFVFGTLARPHIERHYQLWRQVIPLLRAADVEGGA